MNYVSKPCNGLRIASARVPNVPGENGGEFDGSFTPPGSPMRLQRGNGMWGDDEKGSPRISKFENHIIKNGTSPSRRIERKGDYDYASSPHLYPN
jgi:hypothetical protein